MVPAVMAMTAETAMVIDSLRFISIMGVCDISESLLCCFCVLLLLRL